MACESVRSTVCSNIPFKVAKTTNNFCQRNRWEYPNATHMHWGKLFILFEPKICRLVSTDKNENSFL